MDALISTLVDKHKQKTAVVPYHDETDRAVHEASTDSDGESSPAHFRSSFPTSH